MDDRFLVGIYVGEQQQSQGSYIMTETGVKVARSLRRFPPSERCGRELLDAVGGHPWDLRWQAERGLPGHVQLDVDLDGALPRDAFAEIIHRRLRIRKAVELVKYGHTAGCEGC